MWWFKTRTGSVKKKKKNVKKIGMLYVLSSLKRLLEDLPSP